ncbi:helix-turn-helix domain-containing protein [Streptomyces sp. GS7]|uniref:helix-turn-helix domain-containing protein n=1 Tax=Streptomyces sp. GS7 TaxID=2692234 RepID=UPI0013181D9D|nr:helix-turn-helix transcriptional regulator [Streptomyces sp. GS7]QHC22087.1 helix-turn-helix domain-containing protein [Streptomyces sp. GS7]
MTNHRQESTASPNQGADTAQLFGRRLQRLVDTARPKGRQRYTDAEVAAHVGVSPQYIRKLRNGKSVPSVEKAQSLAELFEVEHVDYFLKPDDDPAVLAVERRLRMLEDGCVDAKPATDAAEAQPEEMNADADLWRRLQEEHGVKEIAMRAGQLSPEARAAVLGVVDQLFQSEKGAVPPDQS